MGQREVYTFLRKNKPKWFSSREISNRLKVSIGSALASLKRLRKSEMVKHKLSKMTIQGAGGRRAHLYRFWK